MNINFKKEANNIEQQQPEEKNFVLVVKYECGESGYLTNQSDLVSALAEYQKERLELLNSQSKHFSLPNIVEAKIYRIFKSVDSTSR